MLPYWDEAAEFARAHGVRVAIEPHPGFVVYTHVSGRYCPFHTRVIAATVSEAPYVLDGLLHHVHQTDLRIREHYSDTAGATDHVFGLCHLLGFCFAPRIKDLKDRKLYTIEKPGAYPLLEPLIGEAIELAAVIAQWPELMRLKASIEAGTVLPSVILRKLAAAGPCNALSRPCERSGVSNALCSPCSGCPIQTCVSGAMPVLKARMTRDSRLRLP